MNLVTDIGNTQIKTSIFRGDDCLALSYFKKNEIDGLKDFIKEQKSKFPELKNAIISAVTDENKKLIEFLRMNFKKVIDFNYRTKIPIKNLYNSPKTLGKDRLAAAVAANNIFKNENVLIFDGGTALTVDFINEKGEYIGGAISPGINMRFKALNEFTAKLPLAEKNVSFFDLIGVDTETSVLSGVQNGILFEIEGFIHSFKEKFNSLKVIFTGGDAFFFEKRLKNEIFADPNLVSKGLNIILKYNE